MDNVNFWTESLFGCFDDCGVCCWGWCTPFGPQCIQGYAIHIASEGTQSSTVPMMLAICCACFGAAANRGNLRGLLKIKGNFLADCFVHLFCNPCASCQELREAKKRFVVKVISMS